MSNRIQIRRGTDAERANVIFANGELVWATDTFKLWVGDGVTPGGRSPDLNGIPYSRNSFSNRFNQQVNVNSIVEALDFIFNFSVNVNATYFYGDVLSNDPIQDDVAFIQSLTPVTISQSFTHLDLMYYSNSTYRVLAYPATLGPLTDIQDPNFSFASIKASYEPVPRQVTYQNTIFYVYILNVQALSLNGKTVRYLFP